MSCGINAHIYGKVTPKARAVTAVWPQTRLYLHEMFEKKRQN